MESHATTSVDTCLKVKAKLWQSCNCKLISAAKLSQTPTFLLIKTTPTIQSIQTYQPTHKFRHHTPTKIHTQRQQLNQSSPTPSGGLWHGNPAVDVPKGRGSLQEFPVSLARPSSHAGTETEMKKKVGGSEISKRNLASGFDPFSLTNQTPQFADEYRKRQNFPDNP